MIECRGREGTSREKLVRWERWEESSDEALAWDASGLYCGTRMHVIRVENLGNCRTTSTDPKEEKLLRSLMLCT